MSTAAAPLHVVDSFASTIEQQVLSDLQSLHIQHPTNGGGSGSLDGSLSDLSSSSLALNPPCSDLRSEIHAIQSLFDQWIATNKNKLIQENKLFKETLAANAEKLEQLKQQFQQYISLKASIQAELDHERLELEDAEISLEEVQGHYESLTDNKISLQKQISDFQVKLQREREIRTQKDRQRQLQLQRETPEAEFYKRMLAFDIQAIRKDLMKFTFWNIDNADWSREFSICVDVSTNEYRLIESDPAIPSHHLTVLMKELNETRDLYLYLKRIRQAFVQLAATSNT